MVARGVESERATRPVDDSPRDGLLWTLIHPGESAMRDVMGGLPQGPRTAIGTAHRPVSGRPPQSTHLRELREWAVVDPPGHPRGTYGSEDSALHHAQDRRGLNVG